MAEPPDKINAAPVDAAMSFVRVERDDQGAPLALQTATVRYQPASGEGPLVVDLIGVIHIADRAYFEKLNEQFKQYDAVLYELVAAEKERVPDRTPRRANNPLALINDVAKNVLDLHSQLEWIDYTPKNFVHADLSPDEMAEAIRQRGDNSLTITLSVMVDWIREANLKKLKVEQADADKKPAQPEVNSEEAESDSLSLLTDPQGAVKLKRAMVEQFVSGEPGTTGLGRTLDALLIHDRNQAALRVFQKELAGGKKKIAIFYGAAHMPDFENRLVNEFGLKRGDITWQTAWDLKPKLGSPWEGILKLLSE